MGYNDQNNHNSTRKICGQYTLRDLSNNNKRYHNVRVRGKCLRVFGSSFEDEGEVLELKVAYYCFSLIFVKGRKEGKEYFNIGLFNSISPMGNLRPQSIARFNGTNVTSYQTLH